MSDVRNRPLAARERIVDGFRLQYDDATSERMAGIRQTGTRPEIAVRSALATLGLRFRTKNRDLPGSPDIANRRGKWAIFVHGCYWHRHPGCPRTTTPRRNAEFWIAKFEANVARDRRARTELRRRGFRVLTLWECQTEDAEKLTARMARFAAQIGHKFVRTPQ